MLSTLKHNILNYIIFIFASFCLFALPLKANSSLDSYQTNLLKNFVNRYSVPYLGNKDASKKVYFITSLASCNTCSVQLKEFQKLVQQDKDVVVYILHYTETSFISRFLPEGYNDIASVNYSIWNVNKDQYFTALAHISEITHNTKIKDFDIFEELRKIPDLAFKSRVNNLDVDKIKLFAFSSRNDEIISKTTQMYKELKVSSLPSIIINGYIYDEPMFVEDIRSKVKGR